MPFTNKVRNNDAFQSISLMLQQALLVVKKSRNFLLLVHWVHVHRANFWKYSSHLWPEGKAGVPANVQYSVLCGWGVGWTDIPRTSWATLGEDWDATLCVGRQQEDFRCCYRIFFWWNMAALCPRMERVSRERQIYLFQTESIVHHAQSILILEISALYVTSLKITWNCFFF